MTTMPGLLPLARHYYETRREVLAASGAQTTPWYRLTADELAVAVTEARIILEAVRRANQEHAVLLDGISDRPFSVGTHGAVTAYDETTRACEQSAEPGVTRSGFRRTTRC
ncbi:hypothetical protein U9R90_26925 [Streptomyces sp. E11-3]|uniref:hypothetical protein n=1 Tax=Streptomyces sp. E11-3 TaxID=3110112 RepID=UPI00397F5662